VKRDLQGAAVAAAAWRRPPVVAVVASPTVSPHDATMNPSAGA